MCCGVDLSITFRCNCSSTAFHIKTNLALMRHHNAITSLYLCRKMQYSNGTQLWCRMNEPLHSAPGVLKRQPVVQINYGLPSLQVCTLFSFKIHRNIEKIVFIVFKFSLVRHGLPPNVIQNPCFIHWNRYYYDISQKNSSRYNISCIKKQNKNININKTKWKD